MASTAALGSVLAASATAAPAPTAKASATSASFGYVRVWERTTSAPIALSSPIPDTLQKIPSVIVGSRNGEVYAFGLAHGGSINGWPARTPGGIPVDSTPSVNGTIVYVGVGNAAVAHGGGYLALNSNGRQRWFRQVATTPGGSETSGVQASMAVGTLNGARSVVAGSLGQQLDELRSSSGAIRPGFPWLSSDTEFSTPAVANIYGNGKNYIIGGAQQAAGYNYKQGGHLRVIDPTGNAGTGRNNGGVNCDFTPNQGVQSSPAVGTFLSGNKIGIAVGTGDNFKGASDTDKLFGLNTHCQLQWKASLDGLTTDSPALVDGLGNNHLQVAEGTSTGSRSGTVYLLDGANGRAYWSHNVGGQVIGGITSANLGAGHQDLLVPTTNGMDILDGKTGREIGVIGLGIGLQSSPLVTDDANGKIGITIAGYNSKGGVVAHYEIGGTRGGLDHETGAWPMFHHDPQLTGSTLRRLS